MEVNKINVIAAFVLLSLYKLFGAEMDANWSRKLYAEGRFSSLQWPPHHAVAAGHFHYIPFPMTYKRLHKHAMPSDRSPTSAELVLMPRPTEIVFRFEINSFLCWCYASNTLSQRSFCFECSVLLWWGETGV